MDIFYLFIDKYFKDEKKRDKEHKAGRYLVEYVAKNVYGIRNSEIEIIKEKPKFKYSDIKFSISHSKNIAAVCFDDSEVGFDIEYIKPRDFLSISQRMNFKLEENTLENFYKCWTKYEAEFKLGQMAIYTLSNVFLDEYIISVASGSKKKFQLNINRL